MALSAAMFGAVSQCMRVLPLLWMLGCLRQRLVLHWLTQPLAQPLPAPSQAAGARW